MKLAYLLNTYPLISTTFIVREIHELEKAGLPIARHAVRRSVEGLVDETDIAEQARTSYLLDTPWTALVAGLLRETVVNPLRLARALALWLRLTSAAGGGLVRHAAYLLEAVALRRRLAQEDATHVHAHFSTNATTVAMLCRALGGPPYSFTVHGPDEFFAPYTLSMGEKISRAAFVSCISHFCRSQCMLFSEPACWPKLSIVHCGVAPARYGHADGRPAGGPSRQNLLFVGRLAAAKGTPVLLEAFARLRQRHPEATLTLIGDGPDRPALEAQAAALGVADAVRFAGYAPQTAVADAMRDADIFVLPSFAEGLPVVLMEALASRLPVVATRIAGVAELVEDGVNGLIVPPGDPESLADAMATLLDDPARRHRMGEAGRRRVEAEFDVAREAAWLAELFAHAADGATPKSLRPPRR